MAFNCAPADLSNAIRWLQKTFFATPMVFSLKRQMQSTRSKHRHIFQLCKSDPYNRDIKTMPIYFLPRCQTFLHQRSLGFYLWNGTRNPCSFVLTDSFYIADAHIFQWWDEPGLFLSGLLYRPRRFRWSVCPHHVRYGLHGSNGILHLTYFSHLLQTDI